MLNDKKGIINTMKKKIKMSKSDIIAIVVATLIYIYSFFSTQNYFKFSFEEFNTFAWFRYLLIRISFLLIDFAIVFYIKNKILKLINKDESTKRLVRFFLIALLVNSIFLLLIWPGNWINDELGVLYNAKMFLYYSWQNYLTVIFYSLCLMLFPSAISIILVQVIFISYSFAYFVNYVYERVKTKWIYLLYLILLLPPVIYNNMYPLRITMYTFIELLFLTWLYKKYKCKENLKIQDITLISLIIFILAFWRTEGIYYLALPIIIYFLFKDNKKIIVKCVIMEIVAIIFVVSFTFMDKDYDYEAYVKYKTTAFINPLSVLLQEELNGNVEESLEKINQVIDIKLLKENPSYWNILVALDSSKGLYRENITEHFDGVMSAYFKIVLNNIPNFIKQRIEVFNITNGKYEKENNYYALNGRSDFEEEKTNIIKEDFLGKPISNKVRNEFIKILRGEELDLIKIFWNVKPVLLIMCILLVVLLIKRKIVEALLVFNLLGKSLLVFLTTPASFFMYYYPLYLEGSLIVCVCVIRLIQKGLKNGKNKNNV